VRRGRSRHSRVGDSAAPVEPALRLCGPDRRSVGCGRNRPAPRHLARSVPRRPRARRLRRDGVVGAVEPRRPRPTGLVRLRRHEDHRARDSRAPRHARARRP